MGLDNATILSDKIQNCFVKIVDQAIKNEPDIDKALACVLKYLKGENTQFDNLLKEYSVSKNYLCQMILSNFFEINYYRYKNYMWLDTKRDHLVEMIKTGKIEARDANSVLNSYSGNDGIFILNDVLLYFAHICPTYSYKVVKNLVNEPFVHNIYKLYPLALNEHLLTLDDEHSMPLSKKEILLYDLYEIIVNESERVLFSEGKYPKFSRGYLQELANTLKKYSGHDKKKTNVHMSIIKAFDKRIIEQGDDLDKILTVELAIMTLIQKKKVHFPLEDFEMRLLDEYNKMKKDKKNLISFYDFYRNFIVKVIIINFWQLDSNDMLQDLEELKPLTNEKEKTYKKL